MRLWRSGIGWVCGLLPLVAFAHEVLPTVDIVAHYDNAVGSSNAASQGVITSALLESRPLLRPGELLEYVPGMVVTQHSGDGKANQYFLRGFNLDHGTDFATHLNGMPLNMPSHAHGHGYTDLNLLIPELVQRVDYRKGPYFAQDGDFASAGSADFQYKTKLDADFSQLTLGQRGYQRWVAGLSRPLDNGMHHLAAVELTHNNGPWRVAEDLSRHNSVFMLSEGGRQQGWTASLMHYAARWNATDQVPRSMIEQGLLGRFDSLDPSDGGRTQRTSASLDWRRSQGSTQDKVVVYAIQSQLNLFSNFTYYTQSPSLSDQFMQAENRTVLGLKVQRQWQPASSATTRYTLGLQMRRDDIAVDLANTQTRQVHQWVRQDHVQQNLSGLYGSADVQWTPWLRTQTGLRYDTFQADVQSLRLPINSGSHRTHLWSPKFTLVLGPWQKTEYFVHAGQGFHSNDARGTTTRMDPSDPTLNTPVHPVPGLVASQGYELGGRTEAIAGLQSSLAWWHLRFDAELRYVGDAGGTESGRASQRTGVEWSNRWQPTPHWLIDADLAWSRPRFRTEDGSGTFIPNAVEQVVQLGVTVRNVSCWQLSAQLRHIGAAPLQEDNQVRSTPSTVVNVRAKAALDSTQSLHLDVLNVFNHAYADIAYLGHDLRPYAPPSTWVLNGQQIQIHPGEPRTWRVTYLRRF